MAEMRREGGSEKAFSVKKLRSAHCWLYPAGASRKFLLLEQGGRTMAKQNKMCRVKGFLNYSDVYMCSAGRKGDTMGMQICKTLFRNLGLFSL